MPELVGVGQMFVIPREGESRLQLQFIHGRFLTVERHHGNHARNSGDGGEDAWVRA